MRLNVEQKKIVQLKPNGHMLVKGVAGSGKTTVRIHRIPYLVNHYCHNKGDSVLMITFNKTLVNYIQCLYEKVENDEEQLSMKQLMNHNVNTEIMTIDKIMFMYYKKAPGNKDIQIIISNEKYTYISKAISIVSSKYEKLNIIDPSNINFLIDEIDWINACLIEKLEEYQTVDRIGRATNVSKNSPQKLLKNSRVREAIFELKKTYEKLLEQDNRTDFRILNYKALKYAKSISIKKYKHIIIDESQDLTKVQLEMINLLYWDTDQSSLMFIADNAQGIYPHSWLGKGRSYTTIGYDMSGKSRSLSKNYRTTTQIAEAAYDLLNKDPIIAIDEDFVKPSLVDRKGEYPIYRFFDTPEEEYAYVADLINDLKNDYKLNEICIIAKEKNIINQCLKYLESKNIKSVFLSKDSPNFASNDVKLTTMHSIKGLEFKVVAMIGINEGVIPKHYDCADEDIEILESEERRLFYVRMTRANNLLYITSSKKPSKFIKDIDVKYLRLKRECLVRPYRQLKIEQYRFKDKVIDLYSNEESVRQWIINEMINSYGYKESLIDIEYGVSLFSKKGYVDIAISIYRNNEKIPFVFIETKKESVDLKIARKQLFDYLSSSETINYGVLTNGREIEIYDRSLDPINDIPKFHSTMIPSTKTIYKYNNLRNNRIYDYIKDANIETIEIKQIDTQISYDFNKFHQINIFGDIVAGIPKEPLENIDGSFEIPEEWIVSNESTFILKVTGDSMKNAGIDIGDYIVVNKQNAAENTQIVVATIDGESTLKKLMRMGETILLIPENPNYEPINVQSEDFEINGVVIGILKKS